MSRGIPLPMAGPGGSGPQGLVPCTSCAKCCTYVAVGVNPPTSAKRATEMLWYLYHEGVSIYRDGNAEWMVVFEARCRNLQADCLCGVYEQRPHICRDFDNTSCEVNVPQGGQGYASAEEFLTWLREKKPKVFAKLARKYLPAALAEKLPPVPLAPARGRRRAAR